MEPIDFAKNLSSTATTNGKLLRLAKVTGVGPSIGQITVVIGNDNIPVVARALGSYQPTVDDVVTLLVDGSDLLVLGSVQKAIDPGQESRDFTENPIQPWELGDGAVIAGKIAQNAVNVENIVNTAVTRVKIAEDAINEALIDAGAVTETKIADDAISTPKLQADCITSTKILAKEINTFHLATGAVTADTIASRTIVAENIATGSITSTEILARSIKAVDIEAGTLTSASGVFGTISANHITVGLMSGARISAGTLNANRISGGTISATITITAPNIDGGTITAANLIGGTLNINSGQLIVDSQGVRVQTQDGTTGTRRIAFFSGSTLRSVVTHTATGLGSLSLSSNGGISLYADDKVVIEVPGTGTVLDVQGNLTVSSGQVFGRSGGGTAGTPVFTPNPNFADAGLYGFSTDGRLRMSHEGVNIAQFYNNERGGVVASQGDIVAVGHEARSDISANCHITSAGRLIRSTSLEDMKISIEAVDAEHSINVLNLQPRWYRVGSDMTKSYWGLIAEEVVQVDPRLAMYCPDTNELIGVNYDRIGVLLIDVVDRLIRRVEELENGSRQ